MTTAQQIKKQIDFLQIFRGLAALAVVFHHVIPSLFYYQKIENFFIARPTSVIY